jgi:hypothetical protein
MIGYDQAPGKSPRSGAPAAPPRSQDEIAHAMLTLAGDEGEPEAIDPAHLPAVLEGLAQAKRRQFATDDEVEAAFRRFDQ